MYRTNQIPLLRVGVRFVLSELIFPLFYTLFLTYCQSPQSSLPCSFMAIIQLSFSSLSTHLSDCLVFCTDKSMIVLSSNCVIKLEFFLKVSVFM